MILILNGSPRTNGLTAQMIAALREGALAAGNEVRICRKASHMEAMNSATVLVATFGDTPIQLTRAEPSLDRYLLEENVRFSEPRTSSFERSLQRVLA